VSSFPSARSETRIALIRRALAIRFRDWPYVFSSIGMNFIRRGRAVTAIFPLVDGLECPCDLGMSVLSSRSIGAGSTDALPVLKPPLSRPGISISPARLKEADWMSAQEAAAGVI